MNVEFLIKKYNLQRHPEGGFFAESYRSPHGVISPNGHERSASTAIYFLLPSGSYSAFHRIAADEIWHFYLGGPLRIVELHGMSAKETVLGPDLAGGETVQHCVKGGSWFAAELLPGTEFSFVGCTVAPGFDFEDFELAEANLLANSSPFKHLLP